MIVSTADDFKYEWIGAPRNREGIILELKSGQSKRVGPVHIALAESRSPSDKMYRLTIGDANNTVTWIGRGKHGEILFFLACATKEKPQNDSQCENNRVNIKASNSRTQLQRDLVLKRSRKEFFQCCLCTT